MRVVEKYWDSSVRNAELNFYLGRRIWIRRRGGGEEGGGRVGAEEEGGWAGEEEEGGVHEDGQNKNHPSQQKKVFERR